MEGGPRFEGRVLGRVALESGSQERALMEASWLAEIINPEKLRRYREYPALEGHTAEWIIMEALLARLVEQGPEMDQALRARLRNLVGVLRAAFYPNMSQREQEIVYDLVTKATSIDFSSLVYELTPEVGQDALWIWSTFGLRIPDEEQVRALPSGMGEAVSPILPRLREARRPATAPSTGLSPR